MCKINEQYRMIILINRFTKAFTKIIYSKICKKCEENITKSLRLADARTVAVEIYVYLCFIDYTETLHNVKHVQLLKMACSCDTEGLASNINEINSLINRIQRIGEKYRLKLNLVKTKWMLISKKSTTSKTISTKQLKN